MNQQSSSFFNKYHKENFSNEENSTTKSFQTQKHSDLSDVDQFFYKNETFSSDISDNIFQQIKPIQSKWKFFDFPVFQIIQKDKLDCSIQKKIKKTPTQQNDQGNRDQINFKLLQKTKLKEKIQKAKAKQLFKNKNDQFSRYTQQDSQTNSINDENISIMNDTQSINLLQNQEIGCQQYSKKQKQQFRNRISAQLSRERKKIQFQKLIQENLNLKRQNLQLNQDIQNLQDQNKQQEQEIQTLNQYLAKQTCYQCQRNQIQFSLIDHNDDFAYLDHPNKPEQSIDQFIDINCEEDQSDQLQRNSQNPIARIQGGRSILGLSFGIIAVFCLFVFLSSQISVYQDYSSQIQMLYQKDFQKTYPIEQQDEQKILDLKKRNYKKVTSNSNIEKDYFDESDFSDRMNNIEYICYNNDCNREIDDIKEQNKIMKISSLKYQNYKIDELNQSQFHNDFIKIPDNQSKNNNSKSQDGQNQIATLDYHSKRMNTKKDLICLNKQQGNNNNNKSANSNTKQGFYSFENTASFNENDFIFVMIPRNQFDSFKMNNNQKNFQPCFYQLNLSRIPLVK